MGASGVCGCGVRCGEFIGSMPLREPMGSWAAWLKEGLVEKGMDEGRRRRRRRRMSL